MKEVNVFICSLSFFVLLHLLPAPADWIVVENNNCKALFPAAPANDSTLTETKIGTMKLYTHMLQMKEDAADSNLLYGLIETQYPATFFDNADKNFLKGFFDGVVSGGVKQVNGKLISATDITLGGFPGKEIKVNYGDGLAVITMKVYLANTKLYAVETIASTGKETNANADRFFSSFQIK